MRYDEPIPDLLPSEAMTLHLLAVGSKCRRVWRELGIFDRPMPDLSRAKYRKHRSKDYPPSADNVARVREALRKNPGASRPEISAKLGISITTIGRALQKIRGRA